MLINRLKLYNELLILISLPSLFQSTELMYWTSKETSLDVLSLLQFSRSSLSQLQIGLLQLAVTWYMLEGKLPTGTSKTKRLHQDKLNFLCFGCPSGQLALQHVPCDHKLQKAHKVMEGEGGGVLISFPDLSRFGNVRLTVGDLGTGLAESFSASRPRNPPQNIPLQIGLISSEAIDRRREGKVFLRTSIMLRNR